MEQFDSKFAVQYSDMHMCRSRDSQLARMLTNIMA